ncbi:cation diffusion facilitator family transporter [Noviherbaspirillum massiliense]|uniref:cation diffusion facilitator family transporter n=1 Tax=Noviherbaspirillum massiliense TaxID=1465823 RepID=UPI00030193A9|nr:cation diffusion facilitator family transporter [Noviherbaspirillum massiliense]
MSAGHHHHHHADKRNERSLWIAFALTTGFMLAEVIGGFVTGSLALISDAAHMFTDAAALAISLAANQIGKKPADRQRSFGYYRFEILAAAFNALLLFAVAIYIVYEAWLRLKHPPEVHSTGMLAIAALGLVVNLVSMRFLSGGKEESLNIKGAYLEVWSDMLGSVGVIIGAIIIRTTGWTWVDSAIAVGIGLWVLPRTWSLLKSSLHILLEGVPEEIDMAEVEQALLATPGVTSIHDLHIWSIGSGKVSLTVHAVYDERMVAADVLDAMRRRVNEKFGISHITVQCELEPCEEADREEHFPGGPGEGHAHRH